MPSQDVPDNESPPSPAEQAGPSVLSKDWGASPYTSFKAAMCVAAVVGILLAFNLGMQPLWGAEGRWAVISRHMYRTGEFFNPLLNVAVYWEKPLLSYWLILPFAYLFGGVSEAAVRMPSVIAAVLMLLLTYDVARIWFNQRIGMYAMATLATMAAFVFWARNGQVEMLNATFILWSIWYFLKHKSDEGAKWFYILGVITGLGANLKGLPAYGAPMLCIALASLVRRDWGWIPRWYHVIAAGLLSLLVWTSFPLIAWGLTGEWDALHLVWRENVVRFFEPFDHNDPIWTYFIRIFDLAPPWSLLLPAILIRYVPRIRERSSATAEVLLYTAGVFLLFTLSGSRRPYYLLPILPFVAILAAMLVAEFADGSLPKNVNRLVKGTVALFMVGLIAPAVAFAVHPKLIPATLLARTQLFILTGVLVPVGIAIFVYFLRKNIPVMLTLVGVGWVVAELCIVPLFVEHEDYRDSLAKIKAMNRPYRFLGSDYARITYYLDEPSPVIQDEPAAYKWALANNGIIIAQHRVAAKRWQRLTKWRTWRAVTPVPPEESGPCSVALTPISPIQHKNRTEEDK